MASVEQPIDHIGRVLEDIAADREQNVVGLDRHRYAVGRLGDGRIAGRDVGGADHGFFEDEPIPRGTQPRNIAPYQRATHTPIKSIEIRDPVTREDEDPARTEWVGRLDGGEGGRKTLLLREARPAR